MNMVPLLTLVPDTVFNNPVKKLTLLIAGLILLGCSTSNDDNHPTVSYLAETEPVVTNDDAADDPAIWINLDNTANSLIFGTDKKSGIYVYDLNGNVLSYQNLGNINNVDLRVIDDELHLVSSNRSNSTLDYWIFPTKGIYQYFENNPDNAFSEELKHYHLKAGMDIYGICMGIINGTPVAALTEEEGVRVQYWDLTKRKIINTFDITADEDNVPLLGNEAEGCVFDDENKYIHISREGARGFIKTYNAEDQQLVKVIDSRDGNIGGDPEGVAIYKVDATTGYIILSSQGDSKFNIYDREYPFTYIDSFRVDNVSDTDGIDVTSVSLGDYAPNGILVVQDGYNQPDNQNFKIVSMEEVFKKKE
ncbi:MAG: phytase [Gammaproteobacteria bacterium]